MGFKRVWNFSELKCNSAVWCVRREVWQKKSPQNIILQRWALEAAFGWLFKSCEDDPVRIYVGIVGISMTDFFFCSLTKNICIRFIMLQKVQVAGTTHFSSNSIAMGHCCYASLCCGQVFFSKELTTTTKQPTKVKMEPKYIWLVVWPPKSWNTSKKISKPWRRIKIFSKGSERQLLFGMAKWA